MKIGYFGDGPWAHLALEKIIAAQGQFEIRYIVVRNDHRDPVLEKYARKIGVPFLFHPDVNSKEFITKLKEYKVDINVSMSFNQILKREIIDIAPKGFINCHAGALPFYRGRNVLNWAIINGETKFGVTVHYIDEGIDTGDIIIQEFAPIEVDEEYGSVLKKAEILCASTLFEALQKIKNNAATVIKQSDIHPVGFYCGRRRDGDEWIDWNWTSERIHNFVRAITFPGPGARTAWNGRQVLILKTERIKDAPAYFGKPGEVVGKDRRGVVVKTGDSTIRLLLTEIDEKKTPNLAIGQRLGYKI